MSNQHPSSEPNTNVNDPHWKHGEKHSTMLNNQTSTDSSFKTLTIYLPTNHAT